jgi:predicted kinase
MKLEQIAAKVDLALPVPAAAPSGGSLLVVAGLPGSGKSLFARTLQGMVPSVAISTDIARGFLGYVPTRSDEERRFVYEVCYRVAGKRLCEGQRVIFDATNHTAAHRSRLAELAEECHVPVAFCHVYASEEVVRERLRRRDSSDRPEDKQSKARWGVYRLMVEAQEPFARPHLELDSSTAGPEELAAAAREYWLEREYAG